MSVTAYYRLAKRQASWFLEACLREPSPAQRPIHLAIIRLALRDKRRRQTGA